MARYVIKLGSNIVADEAGALRADLLSAVCNEVAARHEAGDSVVLVSSGAIARGIEVLELGPGAPDWCPPCPLLATLT